MWVLAILNMGQIMKTSARQFHQACTTYFLRNVIYDLDTRKRCSSFDSFHIIS